MADLPVFRANKKRKYGRQKEAGNQEMAEGITPPQPTSQNDRSASEDEINVSDLLKLRKNHRPRGTGVQFSLERRPVGADHASDSQDTMLVTTDGSAATVDEPLKDMSSRFVGSTGQVVDVDKHMMAYIDAEMAKRHNVASATGDSGQSHPRSRLSPSLYSTDDEDLEDDIQAQTNLPTTTTATTSTPGQQMPLGSQIGPTSTTTSTYQSRARLTEVDLGPSAHKTNLIRTSEAIARAQAGLPPLKTADETAKPPRRPPRKPRLGRDGKPLRPRPRKRRNSEDIARDAMVEQLLHETKTDIAAPVLASAGITTDVSRRKGTTNSAGGPVGTDGQINGNATKKHEEGDGNANHGADDDDADERLARQFRQQFMDAMAERRGRHKSSNKTNTASSGGAGGASGKHKQPAINDLMSLSGPKLGGGRSARAKMAALHQAQRREKEQQAAKKG